MQIGELKPCPFCGGEGEHCHNYETEVKLRVHIISCKDCLSETGWKSTKEKSVELWNKRYNENKSN